MILCSTGALFHRRDDGALFVPEATGLSGLVDNGRRLTVDGLEVLVTRAMVGRLREAAAAVQEAGVRVPVVHAPKRLGSALPGAGAIGQLDESAWFAAAVGASLLVLHLWDLPESDARFDERLAAAGVAADVVTRHGVALAVETIPCQVATPLRRMEQVLEHESRITVALDTEFLARHGEVEAALAADWLWSDERVRHVHIKDFDGDLFDREGVRRYLLPGEGSIDFVGFFEALQRRGFSGTVSLEAGAHLPDGTPDAEAISAAIDRMSHAPWRYVAPRA